MDDDAHFVRAFSRIFLAGGRADHGDSALVSHLLSPGSFFAPGQAPVGLTPQAAAPTQPPRPSTVRANGAVSSGPLHSSDAYAFWWWQQQGSAAPPASPANANASCGTGDQQSGIRKTATATAAGTAAGSLREQSAPARTLPPAARQARKAPPPVSPAAAARLPSGALEGELPRGARDAAQESPAPRRRTRPRAGEGRPAASPCEAEPAVKAEGGAGAVAMGGAAAAPPAAESRIAPKTPSRPPASPPPAPAAPPSPLAPSSPPAPLSRGDGVELVCGPRGGERGSVVRVDEDGDVYVRLSDGSRQVCGAAELRRRDAPPADGATEAALAAAKAKAVAALEAAAGAAAGGSGGGGGEAGRGGEAGGGGEGGAAAAEGAWLEGGAVMRAPLQLSPPASARSEISRLCDDLLAGAAPRAAEAAGGTALVVPAAALAPLLASRDAAVAAACEEGASEEGAGAGAGGWRLCRLLRSDCPPTPSDGAAAVLAVAACAPVASEGVGCIGEAIAGLVRGVEADEDTDEGSAGQRVVGWAVATPGLGTGPPGGLVADAFAAAPAAAPPLEPDAARALVGRPGEAWRLVLCLDLLASAPGVAPSVGAHVFCGNGEHGAVFAPVGVVQG